MIGGLGVKWVRKAINGMPNDPKWCDLRELFREIGGEVWAFIFHVSFIGLVVRAELVI